MCAAEAQSTSPALQDKRTEACSNDGSASVSHPTPSRRGGWKRETRWLRNCIRQTWPKHISSPGLCGHVRVDCKASKGLPVQQSAASAWPGGGATRGTGGGESGMGATRRPLPRAGRRSALHPARRGDAIGSELGASGGCPAARPAPATWPLSAFRARGVSLSPG